MWRLRLALIALLTTARIYRIDTMFAYVPKCTCVVDLTGNVDCRPVVFEFRLEAHLADTHMMRKETLPTFDCMNVRRASQPEKETPRVLVIIKPKQVLEQRNKCSNKVQMKLH